MSDFTSNFWSIYVAAITLVSILACLLLLWFTGKARAMTASDNTTGHIWDGDLREMNNPLPRWWAWLFVITIVFSLGYLALYPGLGTYAGKLGWTSMGPHKTDMYNGNQQHALNEHRYRKQQQRNLPQHQLQQYALIEQCHRQCHPRLQSTG